VIFTPVPLEHRQHSLSGLPLHSPSLPANIKSNLLAINPTSTSMFTAFTTSKFKGHFCIYLCWHQTLSITYNTYTPNATPSLLDWSAWRAFKFVTNRLHEPWRNNCRSMTVNQSCNNPPRYGICDRYCHPAELRYCWLGNRRHLVCKQYCTNPKSELLGTDIQPGETQENKHVKQTVCYL